MNCEHCGAPTHMDWDRGLLVCDYCRSEFTPPVDSEGVQVAGETSKICPLCKTWLSDGLMETHQVLYCTRCHGSLISMETFPALVESLRTRRDRPAGFAGARSSADADRTLKCPLCSRGMNNYPYGGGGNVNIDSCEPCSMIWLDAGEMRRIIVAPDPRPVYLNYGDGAEQAGK